MWRAKRGTATHYLSPVCLCLRTLRPLECFFLSELSLAIMDLCLKLCCLLCKNHFNVINILFLQVYLYGGHVTSWKNEHGEELLFVSSKVPAIRKFSFGECVHTPIYTCVFFLLTSIIQKCMYFCRQSLSLQRQYVGVFLYAFLKYAPLSFFCLIHYFWIHSTHGNLLPWCSSQI